MKTLFTFFVFFTVQLFAGIGAGESPVGPLPVELSSFTAKLNGNVVELNWITKSEIRNYGFEIQRSQTSNVKSETWEKIGFVAGHGNSNSPKQYSFTDKIPNGFGYFSYRLKQLDVDGKFSCSNIISIIVKQIPDCFELYQNYPNPFNPSTIISYSIPKSAHVTLTVYDVLGNLITMLVNEQKEARNYSVNFNASGLSNGIYCYRIQADEYVAIKKMILLK